MTSGRLLDYIGQGDIADRPAAPDIDPAAIALYWAEDESKLYIYSGTVPAWSEIPILDSFTDLGDVPSSYIGNSLKLVAVNVGETGLEFQTWVQVTQEMVEDWVAGLVIDSTGIDVVYNDGLGTLTFSVTAGYVSTIADARIGLANLLDLADVVITAVADGDVLTWDAGSSKWINAAPTAGVSNLDDLGDVVITSPANKALLKYDNATSKWIDAFANLSELLDVDVTGFADGMVLTYDSGSSKWVPAALADVIYRVGFFWTTAATASEILVRHTFTDACTFPDDFANSIGDVGVNPAATYTMPVKVNGSSVGSIAISTGGALTFVTTAGALAISIGDLLTVEAPAGVDTAASVSITLRAVIT